MRTHCRHMAGHLAAGLGMMLAASATLAQQVETPPTKDNLPVYDQPASNIYKPGKFVDAQTGAIMEYGLPTEPHVIPSEGVFPYGTLPEMGGEVKHGIIPTEPYVMGPDDWFAPTGEDQNANDTSRSQPLMQGFESIGPNGLTPPDCDLARGYDYEVAVTNDDFAVYDSCGTQVFYSDINDYLGSNAFFFDPKVIFDPWAGRWVMMYHEKSTSAQTSHLYIIVTGDSKPFGVTTAGVWWYLFDTVQDSGTSNASWIDYADLGYSNTQLFASGNMFKFSGGFRWARIMVFNKSDVYAANNASWLWWYGLTNGDGSTTTTPRSAKMQTSWSESGNIDAYFVNSREGGGSKITFWKVRDAFGANTLTKSDTSVGTYTPPADATQPTGEKLDTINSRLMPVVVSNDSLGNNGIELFTSVNDTRSGLAGIHLFKFDAVTEALEFETNFGATNWDYWFAAPAADYSGSCFWVFTRTQNASGGEPEMRFIDMNQGSFSFSSKQVRDGDGSYNGVRWGDYFGGQLDWGDYSANYNNPGRPAKVWLYSEYGKNNSWGTYVGASSVFPQGSISGVSPSSTWVISGPPGGPFTNSSQTYTMSSASGDVGTAYQVESLPAWLDASSTYGQIWTSASSTLSLNNNAVNYPLGIYTDTVVFDDCGIGNGSFSRNVELRVEGTDLQVVSMDVVDGTFNPGDLIQVSGQYKNNGNLPTGTFQADFYASTNTFISTFDEYLGSRTYSSLGAGQTMNFGTHFLTLPCMAEDDYYIGVIVTVTGDIDTSDNVNLDLTPITYEYCPGDYNGDCVVNTQDFIEFLNDWSANNRNADCNNDGTINTQDFICFLNLWSAGC